MIEQIRTNKKNKRKISWATPLEFFTTVVVHAINLRETDASRKYRLHNTIIHGSKEGINGSSSRERPPRKRKILARVLIEADPLPRMKGDPRIIRSCEINWSSLK